MDTRKIALSGVTPSGRLTIGNYIGAISQWTVMQERYDCLFMIADYHAITVKQDPEVLRRNIPEITKVYLASGIDPARATIFQQSACPIHTELAWIFNCTSVRIADLNKMTQFKDKAGPNQESVSAGLYAYPVLMAVDILLYDTDIVPVGEDQKQHVELARDIARRFNNDYGPVFKLPEALVRTEGARIMSLLDPARKMSKSDVNQGNVIGLLDDPEAARKKIMRAVTDSGTEIAFDPVNKPALANLLTIYAQLGNRQIKRLEKDYSGKGYGEFKKDLGDVVANFLAGFQAKYHSYSDEDVRDILEAGKARLLPRQTEKLKKIKQLIGLG